MSPFVSPSITAFQFPAICSVLFMTTMLNVITRLGLPGNSTLENRYLSVDIASTLFYWDHLAALEAAQSAGDSAGAPNIKVEAEQFVQGGHSVPHQAGISSVQSGIDVDQASR